MWPCAARKPSIDAPRAASSHRSPRKNAIEAPWTSEPVDDPLTLGIELPPSRQQQGAKTATNQIAGEREANLAGAPGDECHAVPLVFRLRQERGGLLHHPRHSPAADVAELARSIMLIELARDRGRDAFRREACRCEIHRLASASPVLGPEASVESGLLRACKSCGRRPAAQALKAQCRLENVQALAFPEQLAGQLTDKIEPGARLHARPIEVSVERRQVDQPGDPAGGRDERLRCRLLRKRSNQHTSPASNTFGHAQAQRAAHQRDHRPLRVYVLRTLISLCERPLHPPFRVQRPPSGCDGESIGGVEGDPEGLARERVSRQCDQRRPGPRQDALPLDADALHPQDRKLAQLAGRHPRRQPLVELGLAGDKTNRLVRTRLREA